MGFQDPDKMMSFIRSFGIFASDDAGQNTFFHTITAVENGTEFVKKWHSGSTSLKKGDQG